MSRLTVRLQLERRSLRAGIIPTPHIPKRNRFFSVVFSFFASALLQILPYSKTTNCNNIEIASALGVVEDTVEGRHSRSSLTIVRPTCVPSRNVVESTTPLGNPERLQQPSSCMPRWTIVDYFHNINQHVFRVLKVILAHI
jgi:hypothetical protein